MRVFKRIILLISAFLLIALVVLFSLKTPIARFVANEVSNRIQSKYGLTISIKNLKVNNLNSLSASEVIVTLPSGLPILEVKGFVFTATLIDLLKLKLNPKFIGLESLTLRGDNLVEIIRSRRAVNKLANKTLHSKENAKFGFNVKLASQILSGVMGVSTANFNLNNITIHYHDTLTNLTLSLPSVKSYNGNIVAQAIVTEDSLQQNYNIYGTTAENKNFISINVHHPTGKPVKIPVVENLLGLKSTFTLFKAEMLANYLGTDSIHLSGNASVVSLKANHKYLSENEVTIDSSKLNFGIAANRSQIQLDSTTLAQLNRFEFPFTARLSSNSSLSASISGSTGLFPATNLFESIPKGLFSMLDDLRVRGFLKFDMNSAIDFSQPDSLTFNALLSPIDFRILSYGKTDFRKLNDTLIHYVYVNDSTNKEIPLVTEYKYFRPIEAISPHLKNAVVVAEDGSFFIHKGFDAEGFRYAMAQNIKQNRMARGGSTITQQLIKNLYLNQNKNLVRKAEEVLIAWLIETQNIVDKFRILEIYLNIIEWGPCINGATEASEFYFNKEPDKLQLSEAIFLASIIPKPNLFYQNFDSLGNLKPFMADYYKFVASKMLEREMITQAEFDSLIPNVQLKGRVNDYLLILKNDSTCMDFIHYSE
ncbi:MAG TPA: biosynthetic peptidoglycan transglycosylase [Tenuifilaceae bacterium]|nr:biosynthetic peptidoglycan transglycosylase [Tenuifilaceae bacterium]HPE17987.1 biosynthetic peptidoglycan transglycosylase [Tenuifilaceae bacterium]HPJ44893.1 biosynthetic peptidoglycan transglycosylase [Tenuifilaceae bacterium]HPQ33141.1 biosynthetic peptidoglycan transglycosylase [Tenuifilaceae bacterium]HRX67074.1 biosynthetic peptidoglycan transglycosylase [Tenuifilaceae bacterium]